MRTRARNLALAAIMVLTGCRESFHSVMGEDETDAGTGAEDDAGTGEDGGSGPAPDAGGDGDGDGDGDETTESTDTGGSSGDGDGEGDESGSSGDGDGDGDYYGDPQLGCQPDEIELDVMTLGGRICAAPCGQACPDAPDGSTAVPECTWILDMASVPTHCALTCQVGECPNASECVSGVCIYTNP